MNTHERKNVHERIIDAPVLNFSIKEEIKKLEDEAAWKQGDRNAVTLQKNENLRVVMMSLHKGAVLQEHKAEGPITVFVVSGKMNFTAAGEKFTIGPNDLIVLEKPVIHSAEALEETHFVLTVIPQK